MSATDKKALNLLFQRPLEPSFTVRDNGKSALSLPDSFFTDVYKGESQDLQSRFGDEVATVPLKDVKKPELSFISCGLTQPFSLFNAKHQKDAARVIQILMDASDIQELAGLAAYIKDRVNPVMFQYCYAVAIAHRPDTQDITAPSVAVQFPNLFVEPSFMREIRARGTVISEGNRMVMPIPRNYTAHPREPEQLLAYFREDIGVNLHHWHWHLVYPGRSADSKIVNKNRRGELFYYMHQQIMARYNVERWCHKLSSVKPLDNYSESIPEGYYPKLSNSSNNRTYPGRRENAKLQNLDREEAQFKVDDLKRWTERIHNAIDKGFVHDVNGKEVPLDEQTGIDILGNIVEPSDLSKNLKFYGSLHNAGHDMIAFIHDPDNRFLEDIGVLGDVATAMRDPIFYRWHCNIDNIFKRHKNLMRQYNRKDLDFSGVRVSSIEAKIKGPTEQNKLITYLQRSDVDLQAGLDFGPNGSVFAKYTHLQHAPFEYTINVTNSGSQRRGTARIFICPKVNEIGTPLDLNEARQLAIELDKFTVVLKSGTNTIKRRSDESNLTIPIERSLRPQIDDKTVEFKLCGCGWPDHMLLPKGTEAGMQFDLFCMISDYTGDEVVQTGKVGVCGDAAIFCGLKDELYPDKRSMGFPFDRVMSGQNVTQFAQTYDNMSVSNLTITYNEKYVE